MLIEVAKQIQQINALYPSLKKSFSDLSISFMKKDLNSIFNLIKQIKKDSVSLIENEDHYRMIFQVCNYFVDGFIENGRKTLFSYNQSLIEGDGSVPDKQGKCDIRDPEVIITTTTCKRTDLFEKTVNSFLECCLDWKKYVAKWLVIDDNSSEENRKWMKEKYPFIEFIYKDQYQKGHPKSMNIIYDKINEYTKEYPSLKYVFNLEDDWDFFIKDNYIEQMITVLNENDMFGQCLLNINYSEDTNTGSSIWGSSMKITKNTYGEESNYLRYFIHNHYLGEELNKINQIKKYPNCFYWPHFSFRPGLTKIKVFNDIGRFNETAQHFEMEYAHRYVNKGYKTTFLDGIVSSHIGRRTYERNTEKLNAYDLNNEKQFGESGRTLREKTIESQKSEEVLKEKSPVKTINLSSYVINLERRKDRLVDFFKRNKEEMIPIKVFKGIDGKTLKSSHKIQKAFKTGDYNYRSGIIGCAMSHISIWKEFLLNPTQTHVLVLEDDAKLVKDFNHKLISLLNTYNGKYEIMFLHYNPYPHSVKKELYYQYQEVKAEEWSVERSMRENMGSGCGYILSREGARNLLRFIEKNGCQNAIDWVMFKSPLDNSYTQRVFYATPLLVQANCYQTSQGVDTDIQTVFTSLSYKEDEWDTEEKNYLLDKIKNSKIQLLSGTNLKYVNIEDNTYDILKDICVLPINQLNTYKNRYRSKPVEYYTTDKYIYSIPHVYINDTIYNDKVWNDSYLNTIKPF